MDGDNMSRKKKNIDVLNTPQFDEILLSIVDNAYSGYHRRTDNAISILKDYIRLNFVPRVSSSQNFTEIVNEFFAVKQEGKAIVDADSPKLPILNCLADEFYLLDKQKIKGNKYVFTPVTHTIPPYKDLQIGA